MQHNRARRIITRGPIRVVGIFPSTKSNRTLHWESQLERDRMYHHEIDPQVCSFREQPKTYKLIVDGVLRRYTPDLEVIYHSGATIIEEVKPSERVSKEVRLYQAMAAALEDSGIRFRVVTDTEIRRQPYLQNVKYLLPFRHFDVSEDAIECIADLFRTVRKIPFGQLHEKLSGKGLTITFLWALIAQGKLLADLEQVLNDETPLKLNYGALS